MYHTDHCYANPPLRNFLSYTDSQIQPRFLLNAIPFNFSDKICNISASGVYSVPQLASTWMNHVNRCHSGAVWRWETPKTRTHDAAEERGDLTLGRSAEVAAASGKCSCGGLVNTATSAAKHSRRALHVWDEIIILS